MIMYQLTQDSTDILVVGRNLRIPADARNADYQAYLRWIQAGNTPLPAPSPEPSTQPDFQAFLDLILVSNLYQAIVAQAASGNPVVNTGLTVTMGALLLAAGGSPNIDGLQAGINLLFSGLTYTQAHITELSDILEQSNLTDLVTIPIP